MDIQSNVIRHVPRQEKNVCTTYSGNHWFLCGSSLQLLFNTDKTFILSSNCACDIIGTFYEKNNDYHEL